MSRLISAALCCVILFSINPLFAACNTNAPGYNEDRFTINNNGTVLDKRTGLTWMRCDLGAQWDTASNACALTDGNQKVKGRWNNVLEAVNTFNASGGFAGQSDWRLPNIKEMSSIMLLHCDPTIDVEAFPDNSGQYWTSTPSREIRDYYATSDAQPIHETAVWSVALTGSKPAHAIPEPWSTPLNAKLVRGNSGR